VKYFALFLLAAAISLAANPQGVPKEAVEVKPGVYRYVDKENKAWLYTKSPFGYMRSSEDAAKTEPAPLPNKANPEKTPFGESKATTSNAPTTKVTDQGDSLKFERPSPFGVYRWTKKKTELNDDEKKLWETSRTAPAKAENK
jgi:hypothetical protein